LLDLVKRGDSAASDEFVHRYTPTVHAYLGARWRGTTLREEIADASQEVLLQCFEKDGAIQRVDPSRNGGFRAYLYGIVRRVALKFESNRARKYRREEAGSFHPEQLQSDETSLSKIFDRSWAVAVMKEALDTYRQRAEKEGPEALERVELLRLRFQENLPTRKIAELWKVDAVKVQRAYARARKEYEAALREVLGMHERCAEEKLKGMVDELFDLLGGGGSRQS
jgi:RNA polymerase sigma-70 factor (ECF subfamily)